MPTTTCIIHGKKYKLNFRRSITKSAVEYTGTLYYRPKIKFRFSLPSSLPQHFMPAPDDPGLKAIIFDAINDSIISSAGIFHIGMEYIKVMKV